MAENKSFIEEKTWTQSCKIQEKENAENYELENKGGNPDKNNAGDKEEKNGCDEDNENEDDEGEDNDCDWMTKEEEERKIIQCLKEIASRCTHANPKKRPTSYEVLDMLYKVYEPPKEPWSFKSFCQSLCQAENYEDYENSTLDTPVPK
ncbi:uncharacterized protein LOC143057560 [Mytilus galloprovincialis]|uniref:uncharacterized protein LOC143057560 n=1 Tax=Mytilus galloprovincialis TaxID=29158 RepID=UPI003F7BAE9C